MSLLCAALLVFGAAVTSVQAESFKISSRRVIRPPIPNAGGSATIFGSAWAMADADGNVGTKEIRRQEKLTASGGPPATLVTNSVLATEGPRVSPITPGTTAFAKALVDLSNSHLDGDDVYIDMRQEVEIDLSVGIPPVPPGLTVASAGAHTRDPVVIGTEGFGGEAISADSIFAMDFSLLDVGLVPKGGVFTLTQLILPGAFTDPDAIFESTPDEAELFFKIVIDNTGDTKTVDFTPGASSAMFGISFSRTETQIEADLLAFFGGADDLDLFVGAVMVKQATNNITLANEDSGSASISATAEVPEPATVMLLVLSGMACARKKRHLSAK